jgi:two-component system nitrogen regulation response regulator GlnG
VQDLPRADRTGATPREDWSESLARDVRARLRSGERDVYASSRERFDHIMLAAALAENDDHRGRAAQQLGLGRNTLTRKLGSSRQPRRAPRGAGARVTERETGDEK